MSYAGTIYLDPLKLTLDVCTFFPLDITESAYEATNFFAEETGSPSVENPDGMILVMLLMILI